MRREELYLGTLEHLNCSVLSLRTGTNSSKVREHELEVGSSRTFELTNTVFFQTNELLNLRTLLILMNTNFRTSVFLSRTFELPNTDFLVRCPALLSLSLAHAHSATNIP